MTTNNDLIKLATKNRRCPKCHSSKIGVNEDSLGVWCDDCAFGFSQAEVERERLLAELRDALANIPDCSYYGLVERSAIEALLSSEENSQ